MTEVLQKLSVLKKEKDVAVTVNRFPCLQPCALYPHYIQELLNNSVRLFDYSKVYFLFRVELENIYVHRATTVMCEPCICIFRAVQLSLSKKLLIRIV